MSAAELHHNQKMIRFVWGGCCDVPVGMVRLHHYQYTQTPENYMNSTILIDVARKYWNRLVREGFRQIGDPLRGICPDDLLTL